MHGEFHEKEKFILQSSIVREYIVERICGRYHSISMDTNKRIECFFFDDKWPHNFYECWHFRYFLKKYIEKSSLLFLDSSKKKDIKRYIPDDIHDQEDSQGAKKWMREKY
jgi:hypothetical protein